MDNLSPHSPVQRIVFMKGAQIGGTECGNNWIGYVIHMAPGADDGGGTDGGAGKT
jgi:phage terminase large subunit GpA-like protein